MPSSLEIRLLGPFQVFVSGRPAEVTGPRRHALLALLALRGGRMVPVEVLVDALWGAEVPAAPRNAVQHHVSRLRAALGAESIAAAPDGYALAAATVDALRFEELLARARSARRAGDAGQAAELVASALALWRGWPLQGLPDSPWVGAEAARLEALRTDALEEQFDAALALGEHTEVVGRIRQVLEEHPFRERLWGQLMLALYRDGRQAEALEAFGQARRVLAEQLGIEPGPGLQRLQAAILAHDSALASIPAAVAARGRLPAAVTSFVGRQQALAEAAELVGRHRLVTLVGPPGVGKSRLALEVARAVEHDFGGGVWFVELARAGRPADVARVVARTLDARGPTSSRDPLARVVQRLRQANVLLVLDGCEPVFGRRRGWPRACWPNVPVCGCWRPAGKCCTWKARSGWWWRRWRSRPRAPTPLSWRPRSRCGCSWTGRGRHGRGCRSPRTASLWRRRSAGGWTGCRWRSSWPPRASASWGCARSCQRSRVAGRCLSTPETAGLSPSATCARSWPGAMTCCTPTKRRCCTSWRCSAAAPPLSAVVAIAGRGQLDAARVTQLLGALVDKSILTASFPDGAARYDLLDTVREYALEQMAKASSLRAAQLGHAEYFATVADAARTELRGPDWLACTRRLELEHDNLWAALAYARDAPDPAIAVRLGAGLGWYFALAERVSEGRSFLEAALAAPRTTRRSASGSSCWRSCAIWRPKSWISTPRSTLVNVLWPLPRPVLHRPSRPSRGWHSRLPSRIPATTSGRQHWRRRRGPATAQPETIGASRRAAWSGPRVPSTRETSRPSRA